VKKLWVWIGLIAVVLILVGVFGIDRSREGMIFGTVTDASSGDPVHKAKIVVGGRSTIRYLDKDFQITKLRPGKCTLTVSAPGYKSVVKEVSVGRRGTRVDVSMSGTEILGLDQIVVFAEPMREQGIQIEIRLLDGEGTVIVNFPRIPMTLDATLCVRKGTEEKHARGRLVYSGPVEIRWDSESLLGKIKGIIPKEGMRRPINGKYGLLDVVLHTAQGRFADSRADVILQP